MLFLGLQSSKFVQTEFCFSSKKLKSNNFFLLFVQRNLVYFFVVKHYLSSSLRYSAKHVASYSKTKLSLFSHKPEKTRQTLLPVKVTFFGATSAKHRDFFLRQTLTSDDMQKKVKVFAQCETKKTFFLFLTQSQEKNLSWHRSWWDTDSFIPRPHVFKSKKGNERSINKRKPKTKNTSGAQF